MPETRLMRDSVVGDAWIEEMMRLNPFKYVLDSAGNPTENFLTCPVRLSFCDALFEKKKMMKSDPNSKESFYTTMLVPPTADLTILWNEYYRVAARDFSNYWAPAVNNYAGIDSFDQTVRKCEEKAQFNGYTPGGRFIVASSQFKPQVVDARGNPITNEAAVYPGVWAIVCLNTYASGLPNKPRKGPRYGLQTVMIVGDDTNIGGGGGVSAADAFKGTNVKPPMAAPAGAFSPPPAPPGAPPAPGGYTGQFMTGHAPPPPPPPPLPAPVAAPGYPQTFPSADDDMSQFV